MRFSCIEIDFTADYHYEIYSDVMTGYSSIATEGEAALTDSYYEWVQGDGFQWYADDGGDIIVIAFYESHPLFNCFMFYDAFEKGRTDLRAKETLNTVEKFIIGVYNKWLRNKKRQDRKSSKQ